jgi:hypothetical protein
VGTKGHHLNIQELIEEAAADVREAEGHLATTGAIAQETLALAQARALVAIADMLASIDRRLEELFSTFQREELPLYEE